MTAPALDLGAVRVNRRTSTTRRPELALSRGPVDLGHAGQDWASLLSSRWALAWLKDGPLKLYQLRAGEWAPGSELYFSGGEFDYRAAELPELPDTARHVALCFDQSAHAVVAWEVESEVYVWQYDPTAVRYVVRGPFPGCDPVLMLDTRVSGQVPGSDVTLFCLTPDRMQVQARLQRNLYLNPAPVRDLDAPAVLDQALALPWQIQLVGEAEGLPLVLLTDFYPVILPAEVPAMMSGPTGGSWESTTQQLTLGLTGAAASMSGPTGGEWVAALLLPDVGTTSAAASMSGPTAGEWVAVNLSASMSVANVATMSGPTGGLYAAVIVAQTFKTIPLSAAMSGPTGGTYANSN